MKPIITAFKDSPDEGQGLARDMRVRWAFEEVGKPYDVRLVTFEELEQPEYLALHPFGLIPIFQEGDLQLFETGAIVLHIAEHFTGLLPIDLKERGRAISWLFAALSTVEPPIVDLETAGFLEHDKSWYEEHALITKGRVREVLGDLSRHLGEAQWLDGEFSAGDLMMVMVLRRAEGTGLLEEFPNLIRYVTRATARPAYQRAFADQLAVFTAARRV